MNLRILWKYPADALRQYIEDLLHCLVAQDWLNAESDFTPLAEVREIPQALSHVYNI